MHNDSHDTHFVIFNKTGDAEYKPFVIAVPDVREIVLDGGEDFLILACDGLWDFLSEDDAARIVYNMVFENPGMYIFALFTKMLSYLNSEDVEEYCINNRVTL